MAMPRPIKSRRNVAGYLRDEPGLAIIAQCPWMNWNDSLAGHHVLDLQGRQRQVQAPEIGEVVEHRLDHAIGQLIRLIARCDEHGLRPDRRDVAGIARVHASGNDGGDVIRVRREKPIDRRTGDANQPGRATRRRLLGQPVGMSRVKNDHIDLVVAQRLVLLGWPELQQTIGSRYRPTIGSGDDIPGEGISATSLRDADAPAAQILEIADAGIGPSDDGKGLWAILYGVVLTMS